MRRDLVIVMLLMVAAVGGLVWAHGEIKQAETQVEIREEILMGDHFWIEGLEINQETTYVSNLVWNTTFWPGSEKEPSSEFVFYTSEELGKIGEEKLMNQEEEFRFILYFPGENDTIISGNDFSGSEWNGGENAFELPARDLLFRVQKGEHITETITLSDYYEYYPTSINLWGPDLEASEEERKAITEYFRIPVAEKHQVILTASRDSDSTGYNGFYEVVSESIHIDGMAGAHRVLPAVLTEDDIFIVLAIDVYEPVYEQKIDHSKVAEGGGIYRIPLEERNGVRHPVTDQIEKVFSFDVEEERPETFIYNELKNEVYLTTLEADGMFLRIIDCETMKEKQKIWFEESMFIVELKEDYMVLVKGRESLTFMVRAEDGLWKTELSVRMDEEVAAELLYRSDSTYLWNGEKLVKLSYWDSLNYNRELVITGIDQNGVQFLGKYHYAGDGDGGSQNHKLKTQEVPTMRWL